MLVASILTSTTPAHANAQGALVHLFPCAAVSMPAAHLVAGGSSVSHNHWSCVQLLCRTVTIPERTYFFFFIFLVVVLPAGLCVDCRKCVWAGAGAGVGGGGGV